MCGRYASARKRQELLEEFQVQADHVPEPLEPDYNVAPTKPVYAVLDRSERTQHLESRERFERPEGGESGGERDRTGSGQASVTRQLRVLRWGLVPSWAKDQSLGSKLINARVETVAVKPAFRRAFAQRRCLLPADGYYEWQVRDNGGVRTRKQPLFISPRGGCILAMAGIYELWRVPGLPAGHADAWLWTASIITTRAAVGLGHIHDRMPMVVGRDHWAQWLDPANTGPRELSGLLIPAASVGLDVRPVSPAVGDVRNNGPGLIEPVAPGEDPSEATAPLF